MKRRLQPGSLPLALVSFFVFAGCTTEHYRKSADKEAYGVIRQKTPLVKNMDEHFTVEQTNQLSLEGLAVTTGVQEFLGPDGEAEHGANIISLEKALDIAVRHSRPYQLRKEQLYLQALGLTLDRHRFTPIFSAGAQPGVNVTTQPKVITGLSTNGPVSYIDPNGRLVEDRQVVAGRPSASVSWLLRAGGLLTAAFTTDFTRYLTGDPRTFTSSQLGATLVQPLWRGAGYKVTMENLTQSERNLLYALRDFTLFRKRFSVDVATAYYQVLGSRDAVRNGYTKLQSARQNAVRTRSLAEEGRATQADLGRLEQQQLS